VLAALGGVLYFAASGIGGAVTTVPATLPPDFRGVRALRRSGILPPGPMGGT
jgi:hypothetical protein